MKRLLKDNLTGFFAILLSLALPLVIIACTYEETFQCDRCRETFPEKYMVHDFDLNYICLSCMDEQMLDIGFKRADFCNECDEYYPLSDLNNFGLCESCSDKYLRTCCRCEALDYSWSVSPEYFLCDCCLEEAVHYPEVVEALQSAFE